MVYLVDQGMRAANRRLGMDNNRMAHIKGGLEAGQRYALSAAGRAEKVGSETTASAQRQGAANDAVAPPRP